MANNNGRNDWSVGYADISTFENILKSHTKVVSFQRLNDIQFNIVRRSPLRLLKAVIVNEYVLGEAALYKLLDDFPEVNAVVNMGNWNQIALDWRKIAQQTDVLVADLSHFLGALHASNLAAYVPQCERKDSS